MVSNSSRPEGYAKSIKGKQQNKNVNSNLIKFENKYRMFNKRIAVKINVQKKNPSKYTIVASMNNTGILVFGTLMNLTLKVDYVLIIWRAIVINDTICQIGLMISSNKLVR